MKYLVIFRHREKYPIRCMCQFFGVSRSGYYSYLRRMDKPDRDEPMSILIRRCQQQAHRTYGYRRVHIWLERRGVTCNPKTVLRIMNKYGLLSEIRRRKKYMTMGQHLHKYENLMGRNFTAQRPNQKWATDISYIHTRQGVLYISAIRDLYDNSIVAYKTGTEQTVNLVLNTIREAKSKETVAAGLLLHSDQRFQYTSHSYFTLTKEYGITPSMSRRGNCLDNAMAENFFSILKAECISRQKLDSFQQARSLIDQYIHFYKHECIELKTRLTPFEKRRQAT